PNIPVISDYRHVVIMGETTQSVADKYDIPVQLLKAANPGLGNSVVKGDRLRVPDKTKLKKPDTIEESVIGKTQANVQKDEAKKPVVAEASTPQEPDYIKHLVKKKETLYSIGREYGVTVAEIQAVNKGLSTNIFIGQTINIPKKKISNYFLELRIKTKTKLKSIAALYQIDFTRLKNANPGLRRRVLEGQIVKIPVGETARNFDDQPLEPEIIPDENEEVNIPFAPNTAFQCLKNQPHHNQAFKVALMLPLYLEEMDSLNKVGFLQQQQTSFKPFRFIGFYEGAMMALDSLRKKGMQVELYIYDVDQNLAKAAKVLQQPELRSMNLIIGPLFPDCFHQVALFAGNFNIPIVNPLTFREETVQSYKTVIKVKPGIGFQNEFLVNYFQRTYPMSKVFFITQNPYEDAVQVQNMVNALRMTIPAVSKISNSDLYNMAVSVAHRQEDFTTGDPLPYFQFEGQDIFPDLLENRLSDSTILQNNLTRIVYSSDNLTSFLNNASPLRENLVILYGNKKSFVLDVMNQLNEIRDTFNIKLIGVPTWERLSDLNNTQLSNLNLTYFSSDYMNYESPEIQKFIWEFRQRFSTEPDTYAYLGFDVTYYFLDNLFLFGDQFTSCLETNPKKMLQTTYQFKRQHEDSFENSYWNLLQYKWLNLYKIPDALIAPRNKPKE
ncbi:MAG: LysM peptidoglycan-binding domain-containing protein, partial [Bacteroidales bacterium]